MTRLELHTISTTVFSGATKVLFDSDSMMSSFPTDVRDKTLNSKMSLLDVDSPFLIFCFKYWLAHSDRPMVRLSCL